MFLPLRRFSTFYVWRFLRLVCIASESAEISTFRLAAALAGASPKRARTEESLDAPAHEEVLHPLDCFSDLNDAEGMQIAASVPPPQREDVCVCHRSYGA